MSLFDTDTLPKDAKILHKYPTDVQVLGIESKKAGQPGRKPAHQRPDVTMKHAAYAMLREAGAGPSQAAKVLGYTPQTGTRLEKKLNAYELQREKLLSLATQTTKNFIQGKAIGQTTDPLTGKKTGGVQPKGSDVMRAVELVIDREQPKVNLSANINATFDPVNLDDYYR